LFLVRSIIIVLLGHSARHRGGQRHHQSKGTCKNNAASMEQQALQSLLDKIAF